MNTLIVGACRHPTTKGPMWMDGGLAHLQCVGVSRAGRAPVLCSLIHLFLPQTTSSDTHTHTHVWHKFTRHTIPLDSQDAINLKQTKIPMKHMMAIKQIMLSDDSKSISSWSAARRTVKVHQDFSSEHIKVHSSYSQRYAENRLNSTS